MSIATNSPSSIEDENNIFFYFSLYWQSVSVTIATVKVKTLLSQNTWVVYSRKTLNENNAEQHYFLSDFQRDKKPLLDL